MENSFYLSIHEIDVKNSENMYMGKHLGYFDVDDNCEIVISDTPTKFDELYFALWAEDIIKLCFERKLLIFPKND